MYMYDVYNVHVSTLLLELAIQWVEFQDPISLGCEVLCKMHEIL